MLSGHTCPRAPPANSCSPFTSATRRAQAKAKAVAHTIRREHVPAFQASLRRAQFTLLPEIPPLAMPRRWGPNSHSASLPFLGKPIPRFGAHHKADLRKREEDERDRTKLRAAPTDQTLGVRRASPRRRRKGASRRLGVPEVVDGAARSASSSMSRR